MKVYSPVTNTEAVHVDDINTQRIVEGYASEGIDVSAYFKGLDRLDVYECPDTKFRFYYPFISGDEDFYERLQGLAGYYRTWKWENEEAVAFIRANDKVLDIGCGDGIFLDGLKSRKKCSVTGLEFNQKAVDACRKKGIEVHKVPLAEFADARAGEFDVICMFQVLEHIVEVKDFLDAAIRMLNKNGILIVGVPNNKPYIFLRDKYCTLNLPPHHIGLWNRTSLANVARYHDIEVVKVVEEPSDAYLEYYSAAYFKFLGGNAVTWFSRAGFHILNSISSLPLLRKVKTWVFTLLGSRLPGHSILAAYRKV